MKFGVTKLVIDFDVNFLPILDEWKSKIIIQQRDLKKVLEEIITLHLKTMKASEGRK